MTEKEVALKYANIEDKVPSVWATYDKAAIELAQDLCFMWSVRDGELIRVISLLELMVGLKLSQHIDFRFAHVGLYPTCVKAYNIKPDTINLIKK